MKNIKSFKKFNEGLEVNKKIKDIDFLFDQNEELSRIGSKEQYIEYLKTIFPESKLKEIVYHSTNKNFEEFDKEKVGSRVEGAPVGGDTGAFGRGIYFTTNITYSKVYGKNTKYCLVNIKNPKLIFNNEANDKMYTNKSIKELWGNFDGVIFKVTDWKAVVDSGVHASMEEFNSVGLGINNKPEIVDVVVDNQSQVHILGSKDDIEKFKNFLKI
jgi:hypothetical protein